VQDAVAGAARRERDDCGGEEAADTPSEVEGRPLLVRRERCRDRPPPEPTLERGMITDVVARV
jgi:hypothetical protein